MSLPEKIFNKLITKSSLSEKDCDQIAQKVVNEDLDSYQISSLLSFLFVRGESFNEIYSFVKILRNKMDKISLSNNLMDTCGTGGDNKNSFNLSTATSIALSACGIKIAKHGNRSITSKSGSFDVLESLGIQIDLNKSQTKKFFNRNGICFLFAPKYHSILKNFAHIRKSLQFRTIFNLLGPLLNPAGLKYQLLGVSDEKNLETHAKCLAKLKLKRAWVVHNMNGFDELTTTSKNIYIEIKNGIVGKKKILDPHKLGFKVRKDNELRGGTSQENAFLLKRVFEGESGALRENLILNSAAGLLISEKVNNLKQGIKFIEEKIDNGSLYRKLTSLVKK
jgi:anthranilate phosphoribosyltransferase